MERPSGKVEFIIRVQCIETKGSPRRVRVPGSPTVATPPSTSVSLFNTLGVAPAPACDQNTALAGFETNVLLLRRSPRFLVAPEPSAISRRHKLGAPVRPYYGGQEIEVQENCSRT